MPACTYMYDDEVEYFRSKRSELDTEFRELIEEVEKMSKSNIVVKWQDRDVRKLFRKTTTVRHYELLYPLGCLEYQVFNFSSPEDSNSFAWVTSRETILDYLMGYLNGFADEHKKAKEDRSRAYNIGVKKGFRTCQREVLQTECYWRREDIYINRWRTECGYVVGGITGTLEENYVNYCGMCGKHVRETKK